MLTSDLVVNVRLSLALGRPGLAWRNLLKSVDSRPQEPEAANSSLGHWGLGHTGLVWYGMVWYGMVWYGCGLQTSGGRGGQLKPGPLGARTHRSGYGTFRVQ